LKLHENLLLGLQDFMLMMSSMNRENMLLYDWSKLVSLIVSGPSDKDVILLRKSVFNSVVERYLRVENITKSFFFKLLKIVFFKFFCCVNRKSLQVPASYNQVFQK
jgi:hypothetical protein